MQTVIRNVKEMLKLRTPQQVVTEINELECVKKCYFHFLATAVCSEYPENKCDVEANYEIVKTSLRTLYNELAEIKSKIQAVVKPRVTEIRNIATNEQERKAIMAFNSDKRFTITE